MKEKQNEENNNEQFCALMVAMGSFGEMPNVYAKSKKATVKKVSKSTKKKKKQKRKTVTLYVDSVTQMRKTLKAAKVKKWTTSDKKVVSVKKGRQ